MAASWSSRDSAHVVPDGDLAWLERVDVGAGDPVRTVRVELVRDDPADVVRLEDPGSRVTTGIVRPARGVVLHDDAVRW